MKNINIKESVANENLYYFLSLDFFCKKCELCRLRNGLDGIYGLFLFPPNMAAFRSEALLDGLDMTLGLCSPNVISKSVSEGPFRFVDL